MVCIWHAVGLLGQTSVVEIFKCYVIFLLIINKGVIYKFYWSPVDLISGKVRSESVESAGIWRIPADYTGLDLPIWPV